MTGPDVLVVGAGPAGSSAAILLARTGARVQLIDRSRFPRDKLCGEFVAPESIAVLRKMGILETLLTRCGKAREVRLTGASGRELRLPIPAPRGAPVEALGVSRYDLDAALVAAAARLGVDVIEGLEVREVLRSEGKVRGLRAVERKESHVAADAVMERERKGGAVSSPEARGHVFTARWILAADGRDSIVARALDPQRHRHRATARFGLKAHFSIPSWRSGAVELHYFRGGYVGMHGIGGDRVTVCALIDRDVAGQMPRDLDGIARVLFARNPCARSRLEDAQRVSPWLAVGSLVFRAEAPEREGVLFLGDAAGTIDPFAGEGMSMAFRSAEIVADLLARRLEGASIDPAAAYARRWRREFSSRIAHCRRLGWLAIRPRFQAPLLALLGAFPPVGRIVAGRTRLGVSSPGGA